MKNSRGFPVACAIATRFSARGSCWSFSHRMMFRSRVPTAIARAACVMRASWRAVRILAPSTVMTAKYDMSNRHVKYNGHLCHWKNSAIGSSVLDDMSKKYEAAAALMDYVRRRANKPRTDEFVNWVAAQLGLRHTQVRKVYRWIDGENRPDMESTLALLQAAEREAAQGEEQARAVLADSLEAIRAGQASDAERILEQALRWFDDYHSPAADGTGP